MQFVFLPECCDFVGENRKQTIALSASYSDLINRYRGLAQENNVWLSLGGIHCPIDGTDKIYNRHVVINASGEICGQYNKLHMFDVDTPEFKFRESEIVSSGSQIVPPIQTPVGMMGLQIVSRSTNSILND